jgi:transcriptional regulator with XRE-family HTH domain
VIERLGDLGDLFKQFREAAGWSQDDLAKKAGDGVNRSQVAHLEQGLRVPKPASLRALATVLKIPEETWISFAREASHQRQEFEGWLGELVGRPVGLRSMDLESVHSCEDTVQILFSRVLTAGQAFDTLNSVLVYYAVPRMSRSFFDRYFSGAAFQSLESFAKGVQAFQAEAIRLFSTFGEAYRRMNEFDALEPLLSPLRRLDLGEYSERTVWDDGDLRSERNRIRPLPEDRLEFLGYISAAKYKEQKRKREILARYLRELAAEVRKDGVHAVENLGEKRKRALDSLLKELQSTLAHTPMSALFAPNPAELEAEANRILRDEKDEVAMEQAQRQALANLSQYISADHMDVYVATSMRTNSDFVSVNRFVQKLFQHELVSPLRLRYFNPTQSWIEDRVAKGLVEALMLRRARVTLYMAQKSDSFGKDSEASVALGQGKPVIVYVPKLRHQKSGLDSEELLNESDKRLREILTAAGKSSDELDELDHDGLFGAALAVRLSGLSDADIVDVIRDHWADFALLDETERIKGKDEARLREEYSLFVAGVIAGKTALPTKEVRAEVEKILRALVVTFEMRRARVFKEVHPLALQVILSTGVLNGILVSRSVESCAQLLRGILENSLSLELRSDAHNYRLVERSTGSTIRVIARNNLLSNALDVIYGRG